MGRPARPDLHDALLDAARAEFVSHGLERARVQDITRRAGASKGAFYLHFDSKEEAFEEILQRFMGAMEDQACRREEAEVSFRQDCACMLDAELLDRQVAFDCQQDLGVVETLWRNRQILSVVESAPASRFRRVISDFRRRMHAFVTERMTAKQAAGWIRRDIDPAVMGDILIGSYEGLARRTLEDKERPDLEGWLHSFLHVLYEGMLERPPRAVPFPSPRPPEPTRALRRRRTASSSLTKGSRKERR